MKTKLVLFIAIVMMAVSCQREDLSPNPTESNPQSSTDPSQQNAGSRTNDNTLSISSIYPLSGGIGTELTIKGSGFAAIQSDDVTINNAETQVVKATDTMVVVKILQGITAGRISITVNNKTVTSTEEFTAISLNEWVQKQSYPTSWDFMKASGNGYMNGFALNGKGYLLKANTLLQYDPITNTWHQKASLPAATAKTFCFSFTIGNKAYIGLGSTLSSFGSTMDNEVWEYNALDNTWKQKNNFPGVARISSFSFSINGAGYVGGGDPDFMGVTSLPDFWMYNATTDTWIQKADFPGSRSAGAAGFSLDENGYVLETGANSGQFMGESPTGAFWHYNVNTDTWERRASLPTTSSSLVSATCFTIQNRAYAAIGNVRVQGQDTKDNFWEYNPATDEWTKKADIGGGMRWFGSSFAIGTKGYVGVGNGSSINEVKTDFWEYTP